MPFVCTFAIKVPARSMVAVETSLKLNAAPYSTIRVASWNAAEVLWTEALGESCAP